MGVFFTEILELFPFTSVSLKKKTNLTELRLLLVIELCVQTLNKLSLCMSFTYD